MAALRRVLERWRCDKGAEFVEFALAFPLLLLVVMGIIDFGILFQQYQVLVGAAREGARVAVLPSPYTPQHGVTRAVSYIEGAIMNPQGVVVSSGTYVPTFTTAYQAVGTSCMQIVTVNATFPHQYLFLGGIGAYFGGSFGTKVLTASASMRRELTAGPCP